ncbi:mantle protein-like isoform X1 [Diorhabda carinulata]|uniref:mantle protein-like isoform X1 n=1 Tax=Diorhabda carinulata TaxID=1163345 RepID=UPI0025A23F30|nr:mantle protein-like isoform X1 [Diorhabda carinulata]
MVAEERLGPYSSGYFNFKYFATSFETALMQAAIVFLLVLKTTLASASEFNLGDLGDSHGWGEDAHSTVEHKYDYTPTNTIEHTKPVHIPVIKKTGVPHPHPVGVPVPQVVKVGVPQPYPVHVNVPQPVAVPIYKLVPQEIEKKVPIHVNKLVPVYIKKPYPVVLEKHYPVYIDKPYPVHVPVYKHVYQESKKSYSGFEKHHH